MPEQTQYGDYFWRGGERIALDREEAFFTAIVAGPDELTRLSGLPGVSEVTAVHDGVFKVNVDPEERDRAMDSLRSGEVPAVCHHAYRPQDSTGTRYYLTEMITVKFAEGVVFSDIEQVLETFHVVLVRDYGDARTFLLRVTGSAGMNPIKLANSLAELPEVEYAEPNLINRFQRNTVPPDTHFPNQWHLQSSAGVELVAHADVSATSAWDVTTGSRDVVVAVLDDGFDLSHPDFSGSTKVVHPKDYVDGDSNPFPSTASGDYHGTPCAGVAIAEQNGEGVVGVAPRCAFMPVRFPLSVDDNGLFDIFDFISQHADVVSCSWGPPPVNAPLSSLIRDKFTTMATSGGRRKKGCVIVFAAGNDNAPIRDLANTGFIWRHPVYGLVNTTGPIVNGATVHPHVIAVSASTSQNRKSVYSNWGDEISLCAPSNNFHPLDRGIRVPGRGIWTTDNELIGSGFTGGSRYTGRFGGTSSATPLVAGVAGLVISANPELSAAEVKQVMEETADKIQDLTPDMVLGNKHGTYDGNGHSKWFGFGKVNADRAVRRALELIVPANVTEPLELAAAASGGLAGDHESRLFKVTVGDRLAVSLAGPDGPDFDLYVKRGSPPTVDSYDGRGYTGSSNEKVVVDVDEPGDYFILVRSYAGAGDFDLKVDLE